MTLMEHIASRIRELRQSFGGTGISQEALANALGVATNTVSRWETGAYKPAIEDLDKLARFFGVSVLDLFPHEERAKSKEVNALLRAASSLPEKDIMELRRYAEFKKAQSMLKTDKLPKKGKPNADE